jgi:Na+-transporting NADH:ubiquinone oxidoreductase subunit C
MKNYLIMIRFVLILSLFTSLIFIGMEFWTRPLILANASAEFKTTILDAYGLSYTTPTINQVFDDNVEIISKDGLNFYVDKASGKISYQMSGSGVWGPIIAIITFEPDFKTISRVRVTQQEETPGLGGVVASIPYQTKYEGVVLASVTPYIDVAKPTDQVGAANEVDSITGATRTSYAFETIINEAYEKHLAVWKGLGN